MDKKIDYSITLTTICLLATIIISLNKTFGITIETNTCPWPCIEATCRAGTLYCTTGGLQQLPYKLSDNIRRIVVSNQRFADGFSLVSLGPINFTYYSPKFVNILRMTLRNCSIWKFEPHTFSILSNLLFLDLSFNNIIEIPVDGFNGLHLKSLRLDSNKGITFNTNSFRGLILQKLSLINCDIHTLDPAHFKPISNHLIGLLLTNNKLSYLHPDFHWLFQPQITTLQLDNNSLICNCQIKWLSDLLKRQIQLAQLTNQLNSLYSNIRCANLNNQFLYLYTTTNQNDCEPPKIKLIDILLTSKNSAKLSCDSSVSMTNRNSKLITKTKWYILNDGDIVEEITSSSSSSDYNQNGNHGDTAVVMVTNNSSKKSINSIDNNSAIFKCIVSNENGNSSVMLQIIWPPSSFPLEEEMDQSDNSLSTQNPTLTNQNPLPPPPSSSIREKRFTLLEMLGGILATFTLTMLLFLIIYRKLLHRSVTNTHTSSFLNTNNTKSAAASFGNYSSQQQQQQHHSNNNWAHKTSTCRYTQGLPSLPPPPPQSNTYMTSPSDIPPLPPPNLPPPLPPLPPQSSVSHTDNLYHHHHHQHHTGHFY